MRIAKKLLLAVFVGLFLVGIVGCKEKEIEVVTTEEVMTTEEITTTEEMTMEAVTTEEVTTEEPKIGDGKVIVIDAGHSALNNNEVEPLGPGSSEMKNKTAAGTSGVSTGVAEYVLNLDVSFKLQEELENRGYTVIMVRTTHDIDLSNVQRATVANDAKADAFLRIHANGAEDSSANGAMTICQTSTNPFNGIVYDKSRLLSDCVLDAFIESTGASSRGVWETDTMTGINWSVVPVTIVEMGFMTNPNEDELMQTEEYQQKMVEGIANGVDAFIEQVSEL